MLPKEVIRKIKEITFPNLMDPSMGAGAPTEGADGGAESADAAAQNENLSAQLNASIEHLNESHADMLQLPLQGDMAAGQVQVRRRKSFTSRGVDSAAGDA